MSEPSLFGKACVNCTLVVLFIVSLIIAAVLIWTLML